MTHIELGLILKEMYENAPEGEQVAYIHLFGIKYGDIISKQNLKSSQIINASGLKKSYTTEVSKGIKLSNFVIIK